MNNVRTLKAASHTWIGTAVVVLLFACSAAVYAQNNKNEKKGGGASAPAKSSAPAASHQAQPAAQPAHQAPSQPAHQAQSQPAHQAPSQPSSQSSGQPGRQNQGQPGRQNASQTARPATGQPTPQNAGQPGRPNTGQQFGRPNAGQATPQNPGQPGRPNAGQQFGRPAAGQGAPGNAATRQFGSPGGGRPSAPGGRAQTVRTPNGGMVNRDQSGRVREVHTPGGAVITHRPDGVRSVAVMRPGNRLIVTSAGGHGGYAQRPLMFHNQAFVQRTYFVHGVAFARVYRPVTFMGVALNVYAPMHFYRPGFYAYAYSPWARPVVFNWGWGPSPWFGFYAGYFSPYPQYVGPAYWLTDYLFAMTLQDAFQQRMDANLQGGGYPAGGEVGLTPDVKQAVADEVHRQLDEERAESQSPMANPSGDISSMFSDNVPHVFVVSSSLMVDDRGPGCAVSEGDVLQLLRGQQPIGPAASVVVLASKRGNCRRGGVVLVQLQDLQEMQNHMRETMDQGLAELRSRQGKGGLPALPPADAAPPVDSPIAAAVQPDPNVASDLSQAAQEADAGEQQVVGQSGAAGPVTISLGQSMADVESINGKPDKVIDLGAKKIYVYKDLKITFTDGKVSDVQ